MHAPNEYTVALSWRDTDGFPDLCALDQLPIVLCISPGGDEGI